MKKKKGWPDTVHLDLLILLPLFIFGVFWNCMFIAGIEHSSSNLIEVLI